MIRESLAKTYEYDLGSLFQILFNRIIWRSITLDSRHETNYHLNNVIKSVVLEKDRIAL